MIQRRPFKRKRTEEEDHESLIEGCDMTTIDEQEYTSKMNVLKTRGQLNFSHCSSGSQD